MEHTKLRLTTFTVYVLLIVVMSGCGDNNTNFSTSSQEAYFAVGGIVYAGDSPGDNVSISISDAENMQWTTTSNSDGLWRVDGDFQPGTYKILYSSPMLPVLEKTFNITPNAYYGSTEYTHIENDYIYLGQVNLYEQPLEASISPFSLSLQNEQEAYDGAGTQAIQYSLSTDNDIVINFNYPLWSATDICLLDSNEVPLFKDTNSDGQGDYPLCATFDPNNSTFTFARSDLDQAYLGIETSYFEGTSTMTGLIADNIPSSHYLLWIGVIVVDNSPGYYFNDWYSEASMQAFSPLFGTELLLQGKVYFNVVP